MQGHLENVRRFADPCPPLQAWELINTLFTHASPATPIPAASAGSNRDPILFGQQDRDRGRAGHHFSCSKRQLERESWLQMVEPFIFGINMCLMCQSGRLHSRQLALTCVLTRVSSDCLWSDLTSPLYMQIQTAHHWYYCFYTKTEISSCIPFGELTRRPK